MIKAVVIRIKQQQSVLKQAQTPIYKTKQMKFTFRRLDFQKGTSSWWNEINKHAMYQNMILAAIKSATLKSLSSRKEHKMDLCFVNCIITTKILSVQF